MLTTSHLIAGALIGKYCSSLVLTIVLSLLSHFVLDLIPHWDFGNHSQYRAKNQKNFLLLASLDPLTGLILVLFIIHHVPSYMVLIGALFNLLPDFSSLFDYFKWPVPFYSKFHRALHWKKLTSFYGILFQIVICLIFLFFILKVSP